MSKHWTKLKEQLKHQHDEELVFVGERGASGIIDGKLPNGETYEWSKKERKLRRKWRIAKS